MNELQVKFRLLGANEIDVRIGQVSKPGAPREWYSLLLYKDARCDMAILDETVGPFAWSREHYVLKDNIYCRVGIKDENGAWTHKSDVGVESFTEKEKGESSDSFKRACVNWGIGRELYTAPMLFISENPEIAKKRAFYVSSITYKNDRSIASVVIGDRKNPDFKKEFRG